MKKKMLELYEENETVIEFGVSRIKRREVRVNLWQCRGSKMSNANNNFWS